MKSARITRLLPLALALMLAMFLTACGPSNTVRLLSPAPAVNPVLPAPNAPRVTVVPFTDNRQDTSNLGVRRDGSAFVASDDLAQWVSRGLADELRRQGVKAGLFRPITLWPFPEKQLHDLAGEDHVKVVVNVEMSLGQMIDDVRLAVEGQKPVKFAGVAGGLIPTVEDIVEAAKNALKEAE